jgi:hypothetical protein
MADVNAQVMPVEQGREINLPGIKSDSSCEEGVALT